MGGKCPSIGKWINKTWCIASLCLQGLVCIDAGASSKDKFEIQGRTACLKYYPPTLHSLNGRKSRAGTLKQGKSYVLQHLTYKGKSYDSNL